MITPGIYQHYKNPDHRYRVIGTALHSETLEELIVYETLYDNPKSKLWARPISMFVDTVVVEGKKVPRFTKISDK